VIYGSEALTSIGTIDVSSLVSGGSSSLPGGVRYSVIYGASSNARAGVSVAAGDVDGDGQSELMVSSPGSSFNGRLSSGSVYMIYHNSNKKGQPFPSVIDLATYSSVVRFDGAAVNDSIGFCIRRAGDINGDGFDDFLLGAVRKPPGGLVYLVLGNKMLRPSEVTSSIDLSSYRPPISTGGVSVGGLDSVSFFPVISIIKGAVNDRLGFIFVGGRDINGDGIDDFVLGALGQRPNGAAYLFYGSTLFSSLSTSTSTVSASGSGSGSVSDSMTAGVTIDLNTGFNASLGSYLQGPSANSSFGQTVDFVGDINGDGAVDMVVGAPQSLGGSGSSYLVFGVPNSISVTPTVSPSTRVVVTKTRARVTATRRPRRTTTKKPNRPSPTTTAKKSDAYKGSLTLSTCGLAALVYYLFSSTKFSC